MRWFVEVSRVGESSSDEKYCVEAKQWQAALQEARKLRGDSGPLSKFSIELLDDGYRAVDPKAKLRFLVAKAPPDAELSTESPGHANLNGQAASLTPTVSASLLPPAVTPSPLRGSTDASAPAPPVASAVAPRPSLLPPAAASTPFATASGPSASVASTSGASLPPVGASLPPVAASLPPAAVSVPPAAVSMPPVVAPIPAVVASPAAARSVPAAPTATVEARPSTEPYAGVPSSALSPYSPPSAVHALGAASPAAKPSASPPRPATVRPLSAKPASAASVPTDVIPAAPAVPQGLGPPVAPPQTFTQPSPVIDLPPPSSILRKRQEEPTPETPITYREVAYVVDPGVTRGSVEALLWAAFRDITRELAERTGQKFVQLAVFDHRFDKRPERAPLGTLAWKDWRGNPVLTFPFFDGTKPARASVPAPAPSIKPIAVVTISSNPPAPRASEAGSKAASPAGASQASSPPAASPPAAKSDLAAPATSPAQGSGTTSLNAKVQPEGSAAAAAGQAPGASPAGASEPQASVIPLTREKVPSQPSAARSSRPRLAAVKRRAGEDLIGELFETMHELHFLRGVAEGAEFVMTAIESVIPCEGVLIHVFDINKRQFVVVRARGPHAGSVLLGQTPDSEPFFQAVMRRPGSVAIHDVTKDTRVLGPRWRALGVEPRCALCGPVRQGGRYLGLLEVVNPLGDAPFHQTEQNAIDYVCEQFAEFLSNRPIVLEPDVILKHH